MQKRRKNSAFRPNTVTVIPAQKKGFQIALQTCPTCGKTNAKWKRFCQHCGNGLRL